MAALKDLRRGQQEKQANSHPVGTGNTSRVSISDFFGFLHPVVTENSVPDLHAGIQLQDAISRTPANSGSRFNLHKIWSNRTMSESKNKPINPASVAIGGCATILFHPIGYAKVLIQLGHEPLQPVQCRKFFGFGKEALCYPNVLTYTKYIWKTDGFLGMYRGLLPRLIGGQIGSFVESAVLAKLKEGEKENTELSEEDLTVWAKRFCKQNMQETIARCLGIMASQPFHVIMIRKMAQFVGGETDYDGILAPISEIYNKDGVLGFFAGLTPRLVGEIIMIWLSNFAAHFVNKFVIESKEAQSYTSAVVGLVVAQFTYPFTLVSNVMAVAGAELVASTPPRMPPYQDWWECRRDLLRTNNIKRGSGMFFRWYTGPVTMTRGGALIPSGIY